MGDVAGTAAAAEAAEAVGVEDAAQAAYIEATAVEVTAIAPEPLPEPAPEPMSEPTAAPTMVVPRLQPPQAEQQTQVVPPQPPAPMSAPSPAAPSFAAPDASGGFPSGDYPSGPYPNQPPAPPIPQQAPYPQAAYPQGQVPEGQYPQPAAAFPGQYPPPQYQGSAPYPPQFGAYPQQQPAGPARPAGPPPVTGYDVVASAYDAVRALAVGFVGILAALLLVIYAGIAHAHVPASYAYKLSCWLLGSSLGAPITGTGSVSEDDGQGSSLSASLSITLRVTVWALTFLVLFIIYLLARRREKQLPSRSLGQLFLRSALTGLAVSLILLILALTSQVSDLFDNGAVGSATGLDGMTGSIGLSAGFVFLGPLLLTLAVGLLGRFGVWLHAETTADPRAARAKAAINVWRPAVRTAWQQMSVMGTLIAIGLWIWLAVDVFQSPDTGPYRTAILLGLLVLLPNLAVYGTFIGMGVTLFVGGGVGASMLGQSTGESIDGTPTSGSSGLGILQGAHPWGVWLLLGGVIVGTLAPAMLARNSRRFAVNRDEYALNGAWRSIVVGLVTALVVVILGALSVGFSGSAGGLGSMDATVSLGPSLLGALGLTALWFLLAYIALALSLGHRFQPVTQRQPSGIPPQGTPEYAQYLAYQQYLAQQQQQAYPRQPYAETRQQAPAPAAEFSPAPAADFVAAPAPVLPDQSGATPNPTVTVPLPAETGQNATQPLPQDGSGTHEPPSDPAQPYAQQYAQQYPQQYAQPYPEQQVPPQWAPPGQPAGQWAQQPGVPGQGGPRKRFQPKIVIPLVLVVLAGGGFLAYHVISGSSANGPGGAVSSYFGDLAAGDAKDAVALAVSTSTDAKVINSAATLAVAANRPTDFSVVSTRKPTAEEQREFTSDKFPGTNPTVVNVKYTVRGKQLTDIFIAVQNAQGKWVLPNPYLYVSVSGGWSDKATVDGESFTAQDGAYVFPGAHVVAEPDNPDFTAESVTIVPQQQTGNGETYAGYGSDDGGITLPDPTLSSAGQDAVQKAYSAALDDCATEAETGEGDCGIDNYYDYYLCNSVTWTISTVGTVDVDLSSADSDGSFDWTSDGTVASESGDYYDYFDDDQTFSDETTALQNDGTVVFNSDGTATVTITD